ncbi:hypothetical protein ACFFQW_42460 [Umezawaea endophytica]|uniref:Integral membrane protein n=1 Tax=Umezawaea endophytica TaxID=1654476 RepID=A0A9X2VJZ8_9PSEU|nr:hypothetical protein [Umezawaea endophytica]MCS7477927.1 hypothetical protein [Umezawaea endophytica]
MTASRLLVRRTEQWFVRQGAPTMIEGYGFLSHVLLRMLPTLAFVAISSLVWLVPLGAAGYGRWVLLAVVLTSTVVVSTLLSLFVRRMPVFTRNRTIAVLVGYALVPVVVPVLQEAVEDTPDSDPVQLALFFAGIFAATWLAVTYGLPSLLKAAIRHTLEDLRHSVTLLGRALPPLLFVTLFLFFTGELWQAMNRLGWSRLGLIVALFVAITVLAAAARLREEIGRVEHDLSPSVLSAACRGTPLAEVSLDEPVEARKLTGAQLRNLLLMLAMRQLVQAAVVGLALFGFFVVLGLIVVLPETAEQWIGGPVAYARWLPDVPVALLRNATLFAAFGSMYFAVISMSDAEHRQQFFAPVVEQVERTLAVRAVYLAVRSRP